MDRLAEIAKKLEKKKAELQARIGGIDRDLRRSTDPLEKDSSEQAVQRENDDVLEALRVSGRIEIMQINKALARIEKGEYLQCTQCGNDIPFERLEIVPYTEYCVLCSDVAQKR